MDEDGGIPVKEGAPGLRLGKGEFGVVAAIPGFEDPVRKFKRSWSACGFAGWRRISDALDAMNLDGDRVDVTREDPESGGSWPVLPHEEVESGVVYLVTSKSESRPEFRPESRKANGEVLYVIDRLNAAGEPILADGEGGGTYSVHLLHRGRESLHVARKRFSTDVPLADALEVLGLDGMAGRGELEMEFFHGGDLCSGYYYGVAVEDWKSCRPKPGRMIAVCERGHLAELKSPGAEPVRLSEMETPGTGAEPVSRPSPDSDDRFLKEWRERAWETSERRRKAWGKVEGARMLLDHLTAERKRIDDAIIVARKRLQDAWGENSNAIDEEVCIPHHLVAHYESGGIADEPAKRHHLEDVQSWFQPEIQRGTESDPDGGTGIGEPESSGWVYRTPDGEWRDIRKMEPYGENAPAMVRRSGISANRRDSGMRMEEGRIAAENDFADSDPESLCPHDWVEDRRDFCTGFHHRKRELADE